MIVAITGGRGFIGRVLAERHRRLGDEVRLLSRASPELITRGSEYVWFRGDITESDLQPFVTNADILYHCAGEVRVEEKMHAVHVTGTERLIEQSAGRIGRWVQLSSVGAYGPQREGIITEQTVSKPIGPYETTKSRAEELVVSAALVGKFTGVILRPSNVVGPTMTNRSFFQLVSAIYRGFFIFIGSPGAIANYVHVDNVAESMIMAGRSAVIGCPVYNVSDSCSLEELVGYVCDELDCRHPRLRISEWAARSFAQLFGRLPGAPLTPSRVDALTCRAIYSIDKITKELGYQPVHSMEQAIRAMASTWKSNAAR